MASITPMNGLAPRKLVAEPGVAAQLRRVASREERRADVEMPLREYVDFLFGPPVLDLELPRGLLNIVAEAHQRGGLGYEVVRQGSGW